MNVVVRDKEAYHQQTTERMNKHFELSNWSVQQKLALTCRTLAAEMPATCADFATHKWVCLLT